MFLCENSRYHIFMWEFWHRWLWVKYLFPNFHPKTWQIKIPSMGDKTLSMDKSVIHGKIDGWSFFSVDVKTTNKDDGWRTWTQPMSMTQTVCAAFEKKRARACSGCHQIIHQKHSGEEKDQTKVSWLTL